MPLTDSPLDELQAEMEQLRREMQELSQRVDGVCESNRALHSRLNSLNTMIEDRQQH